MNWKEVEPDVTPITGNYSQYNETYWSSEDEDEPKEEITSNRDEDMKIKLSGEDNINESHDNNKPKERERYQQDSNKRRKRKMQRMYSLKRKVQKTQIFAKRVKIMHMRPQKTYLPTPRMKPRNHPPRKR